MKMRKRIRDYIIITLYLWGAYTLGLTPAAFWWWKLTFHQWLDWWSSSIPMNLVLNYPIGKILCKIKDKLNGE